MALEIIINKSQFEEYEAIRAEGQFNMIDPRARELSDLSRNEWTCIQENYATLLERYPREEAQAN